MVWQHDTARPVEVTPRAGNTLRVVISRTVSCTCLDCDAEFTSTGPASSHARAARHRVFCEYATQFAFVPAEGLPAAAS